MAGRPTTRIIAFSSIAVLFIIFFIFIQPQGPASPETRAPGHLQKTPASSSISDGLLKGDVVMPGLANETAKAELGRATWRFFHTMMARYPEQPTEQEQEALRSFIYLFSRLYPCGECASHFQGHLKKYPPQVSSRNAAAGWACFIHNEVNQMLKKPVYDCNNLGDEYDCGCGDDDENPASAKTTGSEVDEGQDVMPSTTTEGTQDSDLAVEINKEPLTRGG